MGRGEAERLAQGPQVFGNEPKFSISDVLS